MFEKSPSLPPVKRSKKALTIVSVVLAIVIILGVLVSTLPSPKTKDNPQETVNPPKVEITSTNLRTEPIEEHLAYVDLSLQNKGGAGTVGVWATITDSTNQIIRNETIYFNGGESRDLTFTFSEISFSNLSEVHAYTWITITKP